MVKALFCAALGFMLVQLAGAYLLWVGGFEFDQRNPLVAYVALIGLIIGVGVAWGVYDKVKSN